ncbi:MAG: hypothetical protein AAGI91_16355 [Bacteroidota bacterium]
MRSHILRLLYNRAVGGLPVLGTPAETAARFLSGPGTLTERAEEMGKTHTMLCASTGFVCGLPGFLMLPVTLPTNLAGVALVQLHLAAATAFMGGHDPHDKAVRERAIGCLLGRGTEEATEEDEAVEVIDRSAVKLAERGIRFLAESTVGLAVRAGRWGVTNVVTRQFPRRSLPLVGGVLGGASDAYSTNKVAEAARDAFIDASPLRIAELETSGDGAG